MCAHNVVVSITCVCVIGTFARGLRSDLPITKKFQNFVAGSLDLCILRWYSFFYMQFLLLGQLMVKKVQIHHLFIMSFLLIKTE